MCRFHSDVCQRQRPKILGQSAILFIFICLTVTGCATDRHCLTNTAPEPTKTAIRDVRAVIITSHGADADDIKDLMEEASEALFEQTGIRLFIQDWETIEWRKSSRNEAVQQIAD